MPIERKVKDRYRRIRRLAAGGTSEVWLARDARLDRTVAVKVLHAHLLQDDGARRRLMVEAEAAAALAHPGIVEVYEVDAQNGHAALVMEHIDGESLATRLARGGPIAPREAARIAAQVAEALYHAHRRGVIHRDVKPGNILLAADGRAKLVDFGIARVLSSATINLTDPGLVMGTLRYMSPEQLTGGEVGPRTDLYSLGLVLHEMLAGRPAFAADSPVALAEAQANGPPPLPGADPALAAVVAACLQPAVADRPVHVGAVAHVLRSWLSGEPVPALALPPDTSEATTTVSPVAPAPATEPRARPRARRLAPFVAAGVLVIATGMAAALLVSGQPEGATDSSPSAVASRTPAATPAPAWLAALLDEYEAACGSAELGAVADGLAGLSEEEATAHMEEAIADCAKGDEDDDVDKGRGKGNGNGNGNANGNGNGGDD